MDERDDNPWANAASNNDATTKSTFQMDRPDDWPVERATREELEEVDPDSCAFKTLYQGMQLWHLFDLLVGFLIVLYGSIIASSSVSNIAVVFILGVGILLLVRALSGALALSTENLCHRCGLPISAGTSPILACTWFVVMLINLLAPGHVRRYLQEHHMLWGFIQQWETNHKQTLTLLFLGAFLLECARWQLVQSLQRKLASLEATEDARARSRSDLRNRMADRPWWFGRRPTTNNDYDPLTDSLLPVGEGDDRSPRPAPSSWTFLGRPRRNHREYQNVRDDASVDFASVQEEWASRTEEDPYWWSRDEDSSTTSDKRSAGRR